MRGLLMQSKETGAFCHVTPPTLADICLVPQIYKRAALQDFARRLSHNRAHRCGGTGAAGLRQRRAGEAARCG